MWGWKVLLRRALYGAILGWCYHVQECKFSCSDHIVSLSFPIVGKWVHIYQIHKILSSTKVFSSVQWLSRVWLLWPHGLQHAKPPCPSPTPRVYSNSCPLCRWCHPTISSSVVPFSSCLQSFLASRSFQMSQPFTWGGQSIRVSASASVLPMSIQDWFPLGLTGWIFLLSKGLSRVVSNTTVQKHQFFSTQLSL